MLSFVPMTAQPIVPDALWPALLLLLILSMTHHLEARRHRSEGHHRARDVLRRIGHRH